MDDCHHLSAAEILDAVPGLSYRQLNFWTTGGHIDGAHRHFRGERISIGEPRKVRVGSGVPVYYDPGVVDELRAVAALVSADAGMAIKAAFRLARHGWLDLPAGYRLRLETVPLGP